MTWREAHEVGAWVLMVSNAAVGAWCLGAHYEARLRGRALWWAVIAAQVFSFIATHSLIEEELFYPEFEAQSKNDEDRSMLDEAKPIRVPF